MPPVPPDIINDIIDNFAESQPLKELLQLRFVSRSWRPRVDFHAFEKLKLVLHEGPAFVNHIKASNYNFGQYIRNLMIVVFVRTSADRHIIPPEYQIYIDEGPVAIKTYLNDFITCLPNLDILRLVGLGPLQMEYVPCFPHVKHIVFGNSQLKPTQLIAILSATTSLESIEQGQCSLTNEPQKTQTGEGAEEGTGDDQKAMVLRRVMALKSYITSFTVYWYDHTGRPPLFETLLFPETETITMPSLLTFACKIMAVDVLPIVSKLLDASSRSLKYLHITGGRAIQMFQTDELRRTFDLSRCVNLKYIRFEVGNYSQNGMAEYLMVLNSLHKRKGRDKITICFAWWVNLLWEATEAMDQVLSSLTDEVKEVEIAVTEPQKYYDNIIKRLPRTFNTGILSIKSCTDLVPISRA